MELIPYIHLFYHFYYLGPSPKDVTKQYSNVFGPSYLPPVCADIKFTLFVINISMLHHGTDFIEYTCKRIEGFLKFYCHSRVHLVPKSNNLRCLRYHIINVDGTTTIRKTF